MNTNFEPGTIILSKTRPPAYGITIDQEFWLKEIEKEAPGKIRHFLQKEEEMIPYMCLGVIVDKRVIKKEERSVFERYVKRYDHYARKNIHILEEGLDELFHILWHVKIFFGKQAKYHETVQEDARALKIYLAGGYNLRSPLLTSQEKEMIRLYEQALPK